MQTKKGLSNVVATVLIILLAVAAVAIIWSLIRPTLEGAGTSIGLSEQCLGSEAEAITCTTDVTTSITTVKVEHKRGESTDTLIAVLEYMDDSVVTNESATPGILSTIDITFNSAGKIPNTAIASTKVTNGVETQICEASTVRIACTDVTP